MHRFSMGEFRLKKKKKIVLNTELDRSMECFVCHAVFKNTEMVFFSPTRSLLVV